MMAITNPGIRIALVGRSAADVRDVMVEGPSGILSSCGDDFPDYEPSKRRLTWPNGSSAHCYSSEKPQQLRGPQHHAAWCDELAAWHSWDAFDQLQFGLRLGEKPRCIVTTTPRPMIRLKRLAEHPATHLTRGKTLDNRANLSSDFIEAIHERFGSSTLGRQELDGELLSELPGALFMRNDIDRHRVNQAPDLRRIVVAVDPAVTSGEEADESGIVVAGVAEAGHIYILDDLSMRGTPDAVCRRALEAYKFHQADAVVFESNQGGETWKTITKQLDRSVAVKLVHASRGKHARAEPIGSRMEQGKIHLCGVWPELEDQLTNYVPGLTSKSPDRLDAFVWACTELDLLPSFDIRINPDDGHIGSSWI
tara:strand:- start:1904 stop:3001 length:1098 start_codon:yes stop_codon:yes gene_type:complete